MPSSNKARVWANVEQATARGVLPRFDDDVSLPTAPRATWVSRGTPWSKGVIAAALVGMPAFAAVRWVQSPTPRHTIAEQARVADAPKTTTAVSNAPAATIEPTVGADELAPKDATASSKRLGRSRTVSSIKSSAATPRSEGAETTIDGEMRLLNEAQSANQAGDPARALRALEEYQTRFPAGHMAEAEAVAHMMTLCKLGQVGVARQEAERFRAQYPNSPFTDRVKGICVAKAGP